MHEVLSQNYLKFPWLLKALNAGGMGIWLWDLQSGDVHMDAVEQELLGISTNDNKISADRFFDSVHDEDREMVRNQVEVAMRDNVTFESEFRYLKPDGKVIWLGARGDSVAVDNQNYKHFAGVNWDITNIKEAEAQADYVAKEMAHRVKNIIAMISGISRMTAKSSDNLEDYQVAFNQRLSALAGVNQLILGNETRRASLENLVDDTLASLNSQNRISVEVSDFDINEKASQTLVLALNELATNAVKYGALAENDGNVDLQIVVDKKADTFTLKWSERRKKPITNPGTVKGFGSQVLLNLTKSTFKGDPVYVWHENGLDYSCVWPASLMSIQPPGTP